MNGTMHISDLAERKRALDSTRSFIVQAPAGSGKTGLLIQRYLKLLARVQEPEEIVVITFTNKAVAEIKKGVLAALTQSSEISENEHIKLTRKLASVVLQHDDQSGWQIIKNPTRLRIQTIDSLCASLVRQMPILSKSSSQMESTADASDLYREAARATIGLVTRNNFVEQRNNVAVQDAEKLLEHLGNDVSRAEKLLVQILEKRNQWLRHVIGKGREELERGLRRIRYEALKNLSNIYPESMQGELLQLVSYAANNLKGRDSNLSISTSNELFAMPGCEEHDIDLWKNIAQLLLTKEGGWRKTLTKKEGFPLGNTSAEKKELAQWKERVFVLIDQLKEDDILRQCLDDLRRIPPPTYTKAQWEVLGSITRLLPYTVAQLKVVFKARGRVDYTEVMLGALQALGEHDAPTDLALGLDYRIQHLLMDEFQDTSVSQYELITKLTAGWELGDGRTLFVVGDPMQSIYRFRDAEVSLFSSARTKGIGNIKLESIVLRTNFRSQSGIVDWVNNTFSQIMLKREESISAGAVPYTHSASIHPGLVGESVRIHPSFNEDYAAEAKELVEIILRLRHDDPSASIGILGRTRKAIYDEIIPQLKKVGLSFRAIRMEGLGCRPIVQDLLVLTRALAHLADKLAWLAVLRAPWCGLTLVDLYALFPAQTTPVVDIENPRENSLMKSHQTVWEALNDDACLSTVSADGVIRLRRIREVLENCINNRNRQSLRAVVEAAWLALGGPACVNNDTDLEDVKIYLDYLEAHEKMGNIYDLAAFEEGLADLYALPDMDADDTLQLMTVHQSKGLEFDYVIVPGLGRSSRRNEKELFLWAERSYVLDGVKGEQNDLLLAPIQEEGATSDLIYLWLEKLDQKKESFEEERLLYVAATRAKKVLYLFGSTALSSNNKGLVKPKDSLLRKLWPVVETAFASSAAQENSLSGRRKIENQKEHSIDQSLRRIVSDWIFPSAPTHVKWRLPNEKVSAQEIEFSWAGETARHIGSVVHRWLKHIAEDEIDQWDKNRIEKLHNIFKHNLITCGMSGNNDEIELAITQIKSALIHTVNDTRGQWLLSTQKDAQNELYMTTVINRDSVGLIIDRTFISEDGIRWIVDYKTSSHVGTDIEFFLDREQERYRNQLNRYALMIGRIETRPIKLGLYFPLLKGWREWVYKG
tara:strand:+ start:4083 stop:7562 length:3480 start_codon:yes stop_codon:yes gene_type:complete